MDNSVNKVVGIEKDNPDKENNQRKTVFVP
jgi:hypothetical protein